ncbi:MAG: T9SS type A sorting domain-containing protein [Bacteroidota bacterium]
MRNIIRICILLLFSPVAMYAQLEKVFVETYYISDANDATDTTGGYLAPGTTTYRIYIDLARGSKLQKLYGDANHALRISSTDTFFNNKSDGQSYGKDFSKNRLLENTVALDTWITLGQTTRTSSRTYFGVPKSYDDDGSIIGGSNNDGGSAGIIYGLLSNNDALAGIPLTTNDGMDTMINVPSAWGDYGIFDIITQTDSTIFGSLVPGKEFLSYDAGLQNSGVQGVNADSNHVLIAQLTTKGALSFELNLEVIDSTGQLIKYVANDSILLSGEVLNRYLTFPYEQVCGCPDAHYLEYIEDRDCDDLNLCNSIIVFGCLDSTACNYNPDANYNIQSLCCYPGYCNDRDLSIVCPEPSAGRSSDLFALYPNPVYDNLNLEIKSTSGKASYIIYNSYGRKILAADINSIDEKSFQGIDISGFENGLYIIHWFDGDNFQSSTFLKN